MQLSITAILLLAVVLFFVVKAVIHSIHFLLYLAVVLFFLVLFFNVSFYDVINWLSSQPWLHQAGDFLVKAILFSVTKS
ncbi:MAG: hypothetical protein AABX05_05100 [Nanoarchaeota archaeon]